MRCCFQNLTVDVSVIRALNFRRCEYATGLFSFCFAVLYSMREMYVHCIDSRELARKESGGRTNSGSTMNKRKLHALGVDNVVKKLKELSPADNVSVDLFASIDDDEDEKILPTQTGSTSSSQTMSTFGGSSGFGTESDGDDAMMDFEFNQIDADVELALKRREDFLDLTTWRRCVVDECERDEKTSEIILRGHEDLVNDGALSESPQLPMVCRLQDGWWHCKVTKNDIVSLLAAWNEKTRCYCVSAGEGFAIIRPDFLVSGTSVVGGLFCLRKSILSDRFRGIDANNKIMTVGSIVHELLQIVLRRKLKTIEEIRAASDELLNDPQMGLTLYASQMASEEARSEIEKFVDKIHAFVERYVNGCIDATAKNDVNFCGHIDSIQDIEENIWVPKLGLKGKVDVSVHIRPRKSSDKPNYVPLELKTGRASFSAEHTGQLIIYQMMLSEVRSKPVDAGLLLYLREGVMRQVKGNRNEQRDLILLRNDVAHYLSKHKESFANICGDDNNDFDAQFKRATIRPELPEPIHHHSACQSCPYQVLCSMYLCNDPETMASLSKQHPLREMSTLITCHLTEAHIEYFCRWVGLLTLEDLEAKKSNQLKSLWIETSEMRQKRGHAIIDLSLDPNVTTESDEAIIHVFHAPNVDLTKRGFTIGEYLIVSTSSRLAVAAGRVRSIEETSIRMCLERNLCDRYANCSFILDKYESQTISSFNMANLGALLEDTEAAQRLRKIVIDRNPPTFSKSLPKVISTSSSEIMKALNPVQRVAVVKALTVNDYLLLKGLPGTGKTQTLTAIIRLYVMMGKSVLITSHTNSAVDNLLMRLLNSDSTMKFMRLGSLSRTKQELIEYSESRLTANCRTPEELTAVYNSYQIVGVTCLSAAHPLLTQKTFDVCLVDESTQVIQSTVLRPLFAAKKFILVGDPDQLPPIVRSIEARHLGADESLFVRLDCDAATVALTMQYRMNRTIAKLANGLTYCGALKCANDDVAKATMKLNSLPKLKWLQKLLSPHIDQSIFFVNTGNVYARCLEHIESIQQSKANRLNTEDVMANGTATEPANGSGGNNKRIYTNYCEAAIILDIVHELLASGVNGSMIGIIAPYVLQVELLKQLIGQMNADIEVNTVDQYQGRDKEIIIYSCTRTGLPPPKPKVDTGSTRKIEILEDKRRLTVAITRAKHKLIVIGDAAALDQYAPFKSLIKQIGGMNKMQLLDGQQGFRWADVMQRLKQL